MGPRPTRSQVGSFASANRTEAIEIEGEIR